MNCSSTEKSFTGQTVQPNCKQDHAHAVYFICRCAFIAACLLISILAGNIAAKAVVGPHTEVDLISERSAIAPGRPFWVGLHFKMEPGWHIYWVNPGDSGEPPAVQWNLPRGFRAGQIEWPAPQRIKAFTLINYGYQGDVLLPVLMHAPASFKPGSKVNLAATVKWLVCKDECIPAQGQLSLSLPVEKSFSRPSPAAQALFERAWSRLPKPAPPGWKVNALAEQNDFILAIDSGKPESGAIFFPLESEQIKNAAPQEVLARGRILRLRLRKSDQLLKPLPVLNGVVVFPSGPAFVVHARVEPAPRSAPRPSRKT
ncbi:MAG TPA: protein-disulfide reductase DsbD domain-containing protein [Terriglobia bacterium]|nr:protein-disulfide reductase DsbD domain-containing protein [Terriglobia bacterium]